MAPPLVPEIKLHLAEESLPIWHKTEEELGEINVPPPFWAFAWAGGQALARYLLDNPGADAWQDGARSGIGSGLTAIAAMQAGALSALASDIDTLSLAAIDSMRRPMASVSRRREDHLAGRRETLDVILVGDLFYERALAEAVSAYIEAAAARGALVLIGDPQRSYFPKGRFEQAAEYRVPVTRELEDAEIKQTAVWRLG